MDSTLLTKRETPELPVGPGVAAGGAGGSSNGGGDAGAEAPSAACSPGKPWCVLSTTVAATGAGDGADVGAAALDSRSGP